MFSSTEAGILRDVSAIELLREVKALSPLEREKFLLAVLKLEERSPKPRKKSKHVQWPDVEFRAERIFGKRVFPNLVLLEREEETC